MSLRLAWSIEQVPGQPRLYRDNLCQKESLLYFFFAQSGVVDTSSLLISKVFIFIFFHKGQFKWLILEARVSLQQQQFASPMMA